MNRNRRSQVSENFTKPYLSLLVQSNINPRIPISIFQVIASKENWVKGGDFALFSDLEFHEKARFADIVQRSVSERRVKDEIFKGYLEKEGEHVKYFPPLIAVLLPVEAGKSISSQYYGDDPDYNLEILGIKCGIFENDSWQKQNKLESGEILDLSWDKNKFKAIIIDGQHRLSAMRLYNKSISIPINVIVFDKNIQDLNLVHLTRELFININNNAVKVSDTKLILMDDKNIPRVCTRDLVKELSDTDIDGVWKPFGRNFKDYFSLNDSAVPQCLILFPGESEEGEITEIILGQLDPKSYGSSCITSINLLKKFVTEYMLRDDFEYLVSKFDNAAKIVIDNQIASIFGKREYSSYEVFLNDINEYDELCNLNSSHPLFKKYIEYKINDYLSTKSGDDQEDLGAVKISISDHMNFEPSYSKIVLDKIRSEVVFPVGHILKNLNWSSKIIKTAEKIMKDGNEIPAFQQLFSEFLKVSTGTDAYSVEEFVANSEVAVNEADKASALLKLMRTETKDNKDNNVFRTSVGQRSLFWPFKDQKIWKKIEELATSLDPGMILNNEKFSKEYVNKINKLDEKIGLMSRDCKVALNFTGTDLDYYLWEELIISDPSDKKTMKPQNSNAKRASLILLGLLGVDVSRLLGTTKRILANNFILRHGTEESIKFLYTQFEDYQENRVNSFNVFSLSIRGIEDFKADLEKKKLKSMSYQKFEDYKHINVFKDLIGEAILNNLFSTYKETLFKD